MHKIMIVFDALSWRKAGGDIGDNSCFWKPAMIVSRRCDKEGREVADVVFLDNIHQTSHGHLVEFMKPYEGK
jgi:hypothetical protein